MTLEATRRLVGAMAPELKRMEVAYSVHHVAFVTKSMVLMMPLSCQPVLTPGPGVFKVVFLCQVLQLGLGQ
jgi:hypothetical protein